MTVASIPPPPTNIIKVSPLTVHLYGVAIATGVLLAIWLVRRRYAAMGGEPELADRAAGWAVLGGLVGARLAFVSTNLGAFVDRPWAVLFVWEGGLAFFGGLTLGALAAVLAARRHGASLPVLADAAAPGIPLAQAVGRWGNYFNQELYGLPTELPWALEVEPHRRVAPFGEFDTFHPTFLYESLWNLALVGLIVALGRWGRLRQGSLIFVYLVGYGLGRFLVELLRVDTEFRLLGLSRNNWVALLVMVGGTLALIWWQRHGRLTPARRPARR